MQTQTNCPLRNAAILAALLLPGGFLALITVAVVRHMICPRAEAGAGEAAPPPPQA